MIQKPDDFERPRLKPEMASQRLLVLQFVRRYIADWGYSPSQGEIAAGLDIHRSRVRRAIRSLVRDGLLIRNAGSRGLALPDAAAEAIRQLRALGWVVNPTEESVIKATLLPPAALDYPGSAGDGEADDGTAQARETDA